LKLNVPHNNSLQFQKTCLERKYDGRVLTILTAIYYVFDVPV
jgi:hypothetical protein